MIPLVRQCLSTALKYTSCSVVSMFSSQDVILVHITVNVFFCVFDAKELYDVACSFRRDDARADT